MWMLALITLSRACLVGAAFLTANAAFGTCTGDCDGDDHVTVDELVRGVAIALGRLPVDACGGFAAAATAPTVDVLVLAVGNALRGCPSPCAVQHFAVDDPAEGGAPDFRSLSVDHAGDVISLEVAYYRGAERIGPGDFIRLEGTPPRLIAFGHESFQLRSDSDNDGLFERVDHAAPLDGLIDDRLEVRLPDTFVLDFNAIRVSAFSTTSDDHIPDDGALSLACPTTPPPSPTATLTPTPPPVDEWRAAYLMNKQKWLSQGVESYRYRYGISHCYCHVPYDVSITVFNDEIAEIREAGNGPRVDRGLYEYWYHTINGLFALIEEAIDYPAAVRRVSSAARLSDDPLHRSGPPNLRRGDRDPRQRRDGDRPAHAHAHAAHPVPECHSDSHGHPDTDSVRRQPRWHTGGSAQRTDVGEEGGVRWGGERR
jgi:hypothetical protein